MQTLYAGSRVVRADADTIQALLLIPAITQMVQGSGFTRVRLVVETNQDLDEGDVVNPDHNTDLANVHTWARRRREMGSRGDRVAIVDEARAVSDNQFEVEVSLCNRVNYNERRSLEVFTDASTVREQLEAEMDTLAQYVSAIVEAEYEDDDGAPCNIYEDDDADELLACLGLPVADCVHAGGCTFPTAADLGDEATLDVSLKLSGNRKEVCVAHVRLLASLLDQSTDNDSLDEQLQRLEKAIASLRSILA